MVMVDHKLRMSQQCAAVIIKAIVNWGCSNLCIVHKACQVTVLPSTSFRPQLEYCFQAVEKLEVIQ